MIKYSVGRLHYYVLESDYLRVCDLQVQSVQEADCKAIKVFR
ncbi:hypothetical protein [Bacillus thuringiensis]|nr:hypothetical protein [Bacillus thuringiensis]